MDLVEQIRARCRAWARQIGDRGWWHGAALPRPWKWAWERHPCALLGLLTFALYLPPTLAAFQLNRDGIEYLDIARRLVGGQGYVLGVRGYLWSGTEVLHGGLEERSPLYPLLLAGLLRLGLGLPALQALGAGLGAASVGLVAAIGSRLFGLRVGLLSGVAAALNPQVFALLTVTMSEGLTVVLSLLALWLLLPRAGGPRPALWSGAGLAIALVYLTRPMGLLVGCAMVVGATAVAGCRRATLPALAACLVGLVVGVLPITLYSLWTRGTPVYSGQSYLYSVADYVDPLLHIQPETLPSPLDFIRTHQDLVRGRIGANLRDYAALVLLQPDWLLPLAPAWLVLGRALARGAGARSGLVLVLPALASFLGYALTWAVLLHRYQILTLVLLMPLAVAGVFGCTVKWQGLTGWCGRVVQLAVICGVVAFWPSGLVRAYQGNYLHAEDQTRISARRDFGLSWSGPNSWLDEGDLAPMLAWIQDHLGPDEVVGTSNPWIVTFFTARPAVTMPLRLRDDEVVDYVRAYRVSYLVVNRVTQWRDFGGYRDALGDRSISPVSIGQYRLFDTRSIWSLDP